MIIGLDFDNTIVCYDDVFYQAAFEQGITDSAHAMSKTELRDALRNEGKEADWIALQGYVYGPGMKLARPFPGAIECIRSLLAADHQVFIISHRSRFPYGGPKYDLHAAAKDWLAANTFFEATGFSEADAFFNETKEAKLACIARMGCDVFVDDLPEFLLLDDFYPNARRILFDPSSLHETHEQLTKVCCWAEIQGLFST